MPLVQQKKKKTETTCEITGFLREVLDPTQRFPIHPFRRQDLSRRRFVHDLRHHKEGITRQELCEFLTGGCFPNVITLIFELSPHHCYRVLEIEPLGQEGRCAEEEGEVGQVGFDGRRHARELDLDSHLLACRFQRRAVDLPNRGGCDRCSLKLGEQGCLPVGTEFFAEDLVHLPVGHVVGVRLDLV